MKTRKKYVYEEVTEMKRILNILDLTLLGVGSMLGMGVYIMSGALAKTIGPAMFISFIIAGITCILSAYCYAEFAGRAPGTGSAYSYCYITVGEFVAFILGWNLILEYVIGTACLGRGLSGYIDSLIDRIIGTTLRNLMPMDIYFFSPFPDFFAFIIVVVFAGITSLGVRESTVASGIVVIINLTTITALIIIGIINADTSNWNIEPSSVPPKFQPGTGGFFPFGYGVVLKGAATCFYAYIGFDTVATTGNEAKNPSRSIPLALVFSLSIALIVYTSLSATYTLMWPYYDQDTTAPFPYILRGIGLPHLKWFITVGAIAAISGSTLTNIFGMARIVYTIAYDGLLFVFLGKIDKRTKAPVIACMISGIFTGLLAIVFDTDQLLNMTSLGTLMAYTLVAVCILILRYEPAPERRSSEIQQPGKSTKPQPILPVSNEGSLRGFYSSTYSIKSLFNTSGKTKATTMSHEVALMCIISYSIFTFLLNIILARFDTELLDGNLLAIIPASVLFVIIVVFSIILGRQPKEYTKLVIQVKPVPFTPLLTIFINCHLMLRLDKETWIRFIVGIIIGLLTYFWYGMNHSTERQPKGE